MKIALLLSGGVDSSVALDLLVKKGHEVDCFYLKIWLEDDTAFLGDCPWEDDLSNVRHVCKQYNVPLKIISFQKEYYDYVVQDVLKDLRRGFTPSPDIWCNERIKFGAFLNLINEKYSHYDKIASGHYAQIKKEKGLYYLCTAKDVVKDQTYFLSKLNQKQLSKLVFPIGYLLKSEVREIAEKIGLYNKNRKDSQGICFLGKINYRDFIRYHLGEKKGDIVHQKNGEVLGKHKGIWFYTIGQRYGLSLSGGPWYVSKKDMSNNIVYVTHQDEEVAGNKNYFFVKDIHWITEEMNNRSFLLKIRHGKNYLKGEMIDVMERNGDLYKKIVLSSHDNGIASGQSVIFYQDDVCRGSAIIETSIDIGQNIL